MKVELLLSTNYVKHKKNTLHTFLAKVSKKPLKVSIFHVTVTFHTNFQ